MNGSTTSVVGFISILNLDLLELLLHLVDAVIMAANLCAEWTTRDPMVRALVLAIILHISSRVLLLIATGLDPVRRDHWKGVCYFHSFLILATVMHIHRPH